MCALQRQPHGLSSPGNVRIFTFLYFVCTHTHTLLFHTISARPPKQPRMVRTFLKVHTRPRLAFALCGAEVTKSSTHIHHRPPSQNGRQRLSSACLGKQGKQTFHGSKWSRCSCASRGICWRLGGLCPYSTCNFPYLSAHALRVEGRQDFQF